MREGLKVLSEWPTFPQLYADGELVGGVVRTRFPSRQQRPHPARAGFVPDRSRAIEPHLFLALDLTGQRFAQDILKELASEGELSATIRPKL